MVDMVERLRLTVLEASEALGVSDDTIRRGLEGKGPLADLLRDAGIKDNTGRWIIELSTEAIERHRSPVRRSRQHTPPESPQGTNLVDALRSATAVHAAEVQRLQAAHMAEVERIHVAHTAEVARLMADRDHERAERRAERLAAEAERTKLIELLTDATAPWWRRLLGRPPRL
jgi:hypothetical protein